MRCFLKDEKKFPQRDSKTNSSNSFFTPDSKYIYIIHQKLIYTEDQQDIEIYENIGEGKLVLSNFLNLSTLVKNPQPYNIQTGSVLFPNNNNNALIVLGISMTFEDSVTGEILLLSFSEEKGFEMITSNAFDILNIISSVEITYSAASNSHFISVVYPSMIMQNNEQNATKSTLALFKYEQNYLNLLNSKEIPGIVSDAKHLVLRDEFFIYLGFSSYDFASEKFSSPYALRVYKMEGLILVAEELLSSFPYSLDSYIGFGSDKALIAVGSERSGVTRGSGAETHEATRTEICDSGNELLILKFSSSTKSKINSSHNGTLRPLFFKKRDVTTSVMFTSIQSKVYLVLGSLVDTNMIINTIHNLSYNINGKTLQLSPPLMDPFFCPFCSSTPVFSPNGRFFVISGGTPPDETDKISSLLLYSVQIE